MSSWFPKSCLIFHRFSHFLSHYAPGLRNHKKSTSPTRPWPSQAPTVGPHRVHHLSARRFRVQHIGVLRLENWVPTRRPRGASHDQCVVYLPTFTINNNSTKCRLVGGFKYFFIFTPKLGEMTQFDEHIFQRGWFNHQLDDHCSGIIMLHVVPQTKLW